MQKISKLKKYFNQQILRQVICDCESFIELKFDASNVNTVKSATYQYAFAKVNECLEKSNTRINTKHSKTNQYKTNEQSTKYLNQRSTKQSNVWE